MIRQDIEQKKWRTLFAQDFIDNTNSMLTRLISSVFYQAKNDNY